MDIVIPVYNEEKILEKNMVRLHDFLDKNCKEPWQITILSNGSTDKTVAIGTRLSKRYPRINFKHIPDKGKAKALRHGWLTSSAEIVGFMDADLSTGLDAFPECINRIVKGDADVAIGNRHGKGSSVDRSIKRTILSRGYNILLKIFFPMTSLQDAACGFKFFRSEVAQKLIPHVNNDKWFFDSELVLRAEHKGFRIAQVPVSWSEGEKSKVNAFKVVPEYLLSMARLRWNLWTKK